VFVGKPAPDFTLPSQDGKPVSPKDFKGKWVVLYFYPKDFTGGCTLEAHNFQKDSAAYAKLDAVILGVSMQSQSSHKDFCAKEGLGFRLLADTAGMVSKRYGSIKNIIGMKLSARNTFLIDPQGNIARIILDVRRETGQAQRRSAGGLERDAEEVDWGFPASLGIPRETKASARIRPSAKAGRERRPMRAFRTAGQIANLSATPQSGGPR
jgi:peroxiredoxin Q/BCP